MQDKACVLGRYKMDILKKQPGFEGLQSIKHGVLWQLSVPKSHAHEMDDVLQSQFIANATVHECYDYAN